MGPADPNQFLMRHLSYPEVGTSTHRGSAAGCMTAARLGSERQIDGWSSSPRLPQPMKVGGAPLPSFGRLSDATDHPSDRVPSMPLAQARCRCVLGPIERGDVLTREDDCRGLMLSVHRLPPPCWALYQVVSTLPHTMASLAVRKCLVRPSSIRLTRTMRPLSPGKRVRVESSSRRLMSNMI